MTNEELLERITQVMTRHVLQIDAQACDVTKEGKMKGFTAQDSQVLERYAKVLITVTKKTEQTPEDEFDNLSDAELLALTQANDNADETSD